MKTILKPLWALCLLAILCSSSTCGDSIFSRCNEDYNFYNDNFILLYFLDKDTKQNLLVVGLNRYDEDTVQVYDQNLKPMGYHPETNGSLFFGFLAHAENLDEPLNTPIEHTYYVYFEEGDYDTLGITYQIGRDKCDDLVINQWSVSYNDSTYFDFGPIGKRYVSFLKTPAPTKK